MLSISKDFTLEDIRAIRDDYYERYKHLQLDDMIRAIGEEANAGANRTLAEIARIRAEKHIQI